MPRVNLIGSSNLYTNQTCVFGSMAGLAPTTNVRPNVSGLPGYKFTRAAANGINWQTGSFLSQTEKDNGCGLGRNCDHGKNCVKQIGFSKTGMGYYPGKKMLA